MIEVGEEVSIFRLPGVSAVFAAGWGQVMPFARAVRQEE